MAASNTSNPAKGAFESVQGSVSQVTDRIGTGVPQREGELTKRIEEQTTKVPSVSFLGLALGSMAISAGLALFSRNKEYANFVGLWAPSFLLIGIYNKLVKLEGFDAESKTTRHAA